MFKFGVLRVSLEWGGVSPHTGCFFSRVRWGPLARSVLCESVSQSVNASKERFSGLADAFSAPEWRCRVFELAARIAQKLDFLTPGPLYSGCLQAPSPLRFLQGPWTTQQGPWMEFSVWSWDTRPETPLVWSRLGAHPSRAKMLKWGGGLPAQAAAAAERGTGPLQSMAAAGGSKRSSWRLHPWCKTGTPCWPRAAAEPGLSQG
eukprot:gene14168-biopygen23102